MSKWRRLLHVSGVLSCLLALGGLAPAGAATFCAHNESEIQAALTAAQANGEDDTLLIASGNYVLTAGLTFVSTEPHEIDIYGNYTGADCSVSESFGSVTLDGNQLVRPLYISVANGGVQMSWLNFVGGRPASGGAGGGLLVGAAKIAIIQWCQFFLNRTTGANALGGALYASTSIGAVFANNLVFGNRGTEVGGVIWQVASGTPYFVQNTIAANITDTASDPGGLLLSGGATFTLGNNIIWNNAAAGSDFGVYSANTRTTNDIGVVTSGSTAGTVTGERSVDPEFAPCTGFLCYSFELSPTSPLVDKGTDGLASCCNADLAGKPRKLGLHVDIGGYEYDDVLFDNGFEVQ
jgi:hypothetical protein